MIERLLRGGGQAYFDLFEQSGETAVRAAQPLERLLADDPGSDTLTEEIAACEHAGDIVTLEAQGRRRVVGGADTHREIYPTGLCA